jgi:hypothetical protein
MEKLYTNLLEECVHWAAVFTMGVAEKFSNQVLTGGFGFIFHDIKRKCWQYRVID